MRQKGIKSKYSDEQARKFLFQAMGFSRDNTDQQFPLEYMAEYKQSFGVNFSLDKLSVPKSEFNYYYFVTVCLSPPANYYASKTKNPEDLDIIYII